MMHAHLNYVVIVSPPFTPSATAASATVRDFVAASATPPSGDITKVTVIDLDNKFVAYSGTFTAGVREVFSTSGQVYILANDGKASLYMRTWMFTTCAYLPLSNWQLSCLEEKRTPAKLELLYRRSEYQLALNLAQTQRLDESSVADIHRQYGDALYAKGNYDGAMQQFVQTIGHVQPSYVIRKVGAFFLGLA